MLIDKKWAISLKCSYNYLLGDKRLSTCLKVWTFSWWVLRGLKSSWCKASLPSSEPLCCPNWFSYSWILLIDLPCALKVGIHWYTLVFYLLQVKKKEKNYKLFRDTFWSYKGHLIPVRYIFSICLALNLQITNLMPSKRDLIWLLNSVSICVTVIKSFGCSDPSRWMECTELNDKGSSCFPAVYSGHELDHSSLVLHTSRLQP